MEHVVYLLGAGFSAPLGLPVMRDFKLKSQDMYLSDPRTYAHFKEVFDTIRDMSLIKNYYDSNLFNIEEILSILEMGEYLEGKRLKDVFLKYIKDVIAYFTPSLETYEPGKIPGNWWDSLFGPGARWRPYGYFISSLLNVSVHPGVRGFSGNYKDLICEIATDPKVTYSIITLNYDLVPETIINHLNGFTVTMVDPIAFNRGYGGLSKLHGSIDTGVIVPPTWSKGVNTSIVSEWKVAYQFLSEATQLRILGYSLATADAYVKYLLKSAITKEPRLKQIDVICRDADGSVKARYDEFIKFDYYRFVSRSVDEYLALNNQMSGGDRTGLKFNKLEMAHANFMSRTH